MLFGNRHEGRAHIIAVMRDVVEIVAIVAAGCWAFYIFAYENRIKPSLADPHVDVTASLRNLGEHHGPIAIEYHQELHNVGTVAAIFLGLALNIDGRRVTVTKTRAVPSRPVTYNTVPITSLSLSR